MGLDAMKPVFGVSNKARLKRVSSASEQAYINFDTFQRANNKGADPLLIATLKTGFLASRRIYECGRVNYSFAMFYVKIVCTVCLCQGYNDK